MYGVNVKRVIRVFAVYSKVLLLGITLLIPATRSVALAFPIESTQRATENLTQKLLVHQHKLLRSPPEAANKLQQELRSIALERRLMLEALVESNPAAVLRLTIPSSVRTKMPTEIRDQLEYRTEISGALEIFYEEYHDGNSLARKYIDTGDRKIELHPIVETPHAFAPSGTRVRMEGVLIGNHLVTESGSLPVLLEAPKSGKGNNVSSSDEPGTGSSTPTALGDQSTLLILVNFQDDPAESYTPAYARDVLFGTTKQFFLENSNQQTSIAGDVTGWFTMSLATAECNQWAIAEQAQAAASSAGIDVANYEHLVYAFPRSQACGWRGLSSVGGSPSQAWINGTFELKVVAHELGHSLGLHHSHSLECGDATLGKDCTSYEYNDFFDTMGTADSAHFNAFQKERMGWVGDAGIQYESVGSEGIYTIDTYASPTLGPKALKILKSTDALTGARTWFYVESRKATGFDALDRDIANSENVSNGVLIRIGTEDNGDSSYIIDMTPSSGDSIYLDWLDPALLVGETFHDPESGISITPRTVDSHSALVEVVLGPQDCVPTPPAIRVSPAQGEWVQAGTTISYLAEITNLNGGLCDQSAFSLNVAAPEGWATQVETGLFSLTPGESVSVAFFVTSPQQASDGFYEVSVAVADYQEPLQVQTTVVSYVVAEGVATSDTVAPSAPGTLSAAEAPNHVTLSWVESVDNIGVSGYRVWRDGLLIGDVAQAGYVDQALASNRTYQYTVNAYDAAGNFSAKSNSVTAGGTKRRNGNKK